MAPLLIRKRPTITVLHVQEDGRATDVEECLLEDRKTLQELGHEPQVKTTKGNFVDEVLREIKTLPYDLVVLGAYGHTKPRVLRVISDEALNLVRSTTLPVLVFRDKSA